MKRVLNVLPLTLISLFALVVLAIPVYSEPPNLSLVKSEIKNYHDSGRYQKDLTAAIQRAQKYIIDQALINEKKKPHQSLALVLDIDETSLSNYDNLVSHDFSGNRKQIHQYILKANAPVIKPMLALYNAALRHGIKVFFVTGREESELDATQLNLIKAGYTNWSGIYLRPQKYTYKSIIPFKSHVRAMISQKGYTVVAAIGDQWSDIKGGYAEKGFKLPNPFYYLP